MSKYFVCCGCKTGWCDGCVPDDTLLGENATSVSSIQTVKYVKLFDSHNIYEVKGIDPFFEGEGTAYMLEVEEGMIEPCGESLVEQTFFTDQEMNTYKQQRGH